MSISHSSVVVAVKDQVSCDLDGEAAILNLATGVYYGLDAVGAMIWNLLQSPIAVSQVRDAVLEAYAVGPDQCEQDLIELLEHLAAEGLIHVHASEST